MENQNTKDSLEHCRNVILENLQTIKGAPSVQFQEVPPDFVSGDHDDDDVDMDSRQADVSKNSAGGEKRQHEAEFYEDDKDNKDV